MHTATIEKSVGLTGERSFVVTRSGDKPVAGQRLRDQLLRHSVPRTGVKEIDDYRTRNVRNVLRGLPAIAVARAVKAPTFCGVVDAKVFRGAEWDDFGRLIHAREILHYGIISCRVVTTVGVQFIVDAFQNSVELENMKYHAFGTGSNAEAVGNTALHTELTTEYAVNNTRPTGSLTEGASANIFRTVGTLSPDATVAITEHGIFDQASNAGGVLLDKSLFSEINLVSGDSLQITYDLTIAAGS